MPAQVEGEIEFVVSAGRNIHQSENLTYFPKEDRECLFEHPIYGTDDGFNVVLMVNPPVQEVHTPERVTVNGKVTDINPVVTLPSGTRIVPIRR